MNAPSMDVAARRYPIAPCAWIHALRTRARWLAASLVLAVCSAATLTATQPASAGPIETVFHNTKAGSSVVVDHSAWTRLLAAYVKPQADGLNRVDYARFKAEGRPALNAYLAQLQATDPTKLDRNEQFAYWANLYNAKTIDIVLEAYPVASIKDIKFGSFLASGPWAKKVLRVFDIELSLDDIEHKILRPYFKDGMVHYAVNCASIGCPNLGTEAFTGAKLGQQLDAAARAFVNHPRGIKVTNGKVEASKIYNWFGSDFGKSEAEVLAHTRMYAKPAQQEALAKATKINSFDYDWTLNDIAR